MVESVIHLPVEQPFPWPKLLDYLSTRCIPEFEHIENNRYYRQHSGISIAVAHDQKLRQLEIRFDKSLSKKDVQLRISQLFYPALKTNGIYRQLGKHLPIAKEFLGMRPLGCWDGFELCARTIIGQQVSVAAAQTLIKRLVTRCGHLEPEAVLKADLENIGMPERRIQTIRNLAQAVANHGIDLSWPWQQLDQALANLPGIGPWTRGYLAIRLGRCEDAFPETDIGLIRAAGVSNAKELLQRAEQWRPFRAYAATYLWAS